MPIKGGKNKRKGKKPTANNPNKAIIRKEDGQEYAKVTKMLGNCKIMAICHDTKERMCRIRGAMRKRRWINLGDFILVSLRDFSDTMVDIIHLYEKDDIDYLCSTNDITLSNFDTEQDAVQSDVVDFTNEETVESINDAGEDSLNADSLNADSKVSASPTGTKQDLLGDI